MDVFASSSITKSFIFVFCRIYGPSLAARPSAPCLLESDTITMSFQRLLWFSVVPFFILFSSFRDIPHCISLDLSFSSACFLSSFLILFVQNCCSCVPFWLAFASVSFFLCRLEWLRFYSISSSVFHLLNSLPFSTPRGSQLCFFFLRSPSILASLSIFSLFENRLCQSIALGSRPYVVIFCWFCVCFSFPLSLFIHWLS